jgi:hypothetical protein
VKVTGQFFKKDSFKGKDGERHSVVLLDVSPDGAADQQFFEIPAEGLPGLEKVKMGDFVEFSGRVVSANGGRVRFWPVHTAKIVTARA